jgi:hypothetical protein
MSGEISIGVVHSLNPATRVRAGSIDVGNRPSGDVYVRAQRGGAQTTLALRPEIALRVAELMARAACAAPADADERRQAARKIAASHLMVAREIVRTGSREGVTTTEVIRAIASALANELRRGVTLGQSVDGEHAMIAALQIGDESEATDAAA